MVFWSLLLSMHTFWKNNYEGSMSGKLAHTLKYSPLPLILCEHYVAASGVGVDFCRLD
jgi:hypothetical protein